MPRIMALPSARRGPEWLRGGWDVHDSERWMGPPSWGNPRMEETGNRLINGRCMALMWMVFVFSMWESTSQPAFRKVMWCWRFLRWRRNVLLVAVSQYDRWDLGKVDDSLEKLIFGSMVVLPSYSGRRWHFFVSEGLDLLRFVRFIHGYPILGLDRCGSIGFLKHLETIGWLVGYGLWV